MSSTETIAEVLAAHMRDHGHRDMRSHCTCGWAGRIGQGSWVRDHREHQAEMVAAALEPVSREREKKAWDACAEYAPLFRPSNPYDTKEEA